MDFEIYLFILEPFNSNHFDASFKPIVQGFKSSTSINQNGIWIQTRVTEMQAEMIIQSSNLFLFVVVIIIVYILSYTEFPVIIESKLLFSNQIVI